MSYKEWPITKGYININLFALTGGHQEVVSIETMNLPAELGDSQVGLFTAILNHLNDHYEPPISVMTNSAVVKMIIFMGGNDCTIGSNDMIIV